MKHIRLATETEIEAIKDISDLSGAYSVLAMDHGNEAPDLAVARPIYQLDPVHFSSQTNAVQKAKFIYSLEERMIGAGIREYYFAVAADDEKWQRTVIGWGCEQVSKEPQLRFKKIL